MDSKVKVRGDFSRVNEEERNFINKKLEKFETKFGPLFNEMHIKMDCKLHKETSRGRYAHFCKVSIFTDHGNFAAEDQQFSADKTISSCLAKIEKQISKEAAKKHI